MNIHSLTHSLINW